MVIGVEHLDGSNVLAELPDGTILPYDVQAVVNAHGVRQGEDKRKGQSKKRGGYGREEETRFRRRSRDRG